MGPLLNPPIASSQGPHHFNSELVSGTAGMAEKAGTGAQETPASTFYSLASHLPAVLYLLPEAVAGMTGKKSRA